MHNNKGLIFKIETFGAVDGPGIRLVIFLQGCLFRCKYCHNPEGWTVGQKTPFIKTVNDVIKIYQQNISFYKHGGITLSGGEPMIQYDFVLALAKKCHKNKIHLTIDTSACTIVDNFCQYISLLPYVDLWLVDIKGLNCQDHKYITNCKNLTGIKLCQLLEQHKKTFWVRYVVVKNITSKKKQIITLAKTLASFKYLQKIELIPYHNMAISKYKSLKINYPFISTPLMDNKEYNNVVKLFNNNLCLFKRR